MRSERPRSRLGLLALLLLPAMAAGAEERDLQPVPPPILFPDPAVLDPQTAEDIAHDVAISFADLNRVGPCRQRLVRRFGLVSVPHLVRILSEESSSRTQWWNAALSLGALRDIHGPALELQRDALRAIALRLGGQHEEWTRITSALALGCWPWTEVLPEDRTPTDATIVQPARVRDEALRYLDAGREALVGLAADASPTASTAGLLALAKSGGPQARAAVAAIDPGSYAPVEPRRAALLARGVLGVADGDVFLAQLQPEVQKVVVAAAALGLALAFVRDEPVDLDAHLDRLEVALQGVDARGQAIEMAEALFARGMIARHRGRTDAFARATFDKLLLPTSTEADVARAGIQALLFMQGRNDYVDAACTAAAANPPRELRPGVLAFLLFRAGLAAEPEGLKSCCDWLGQRSKRPVPGADDDPRPFAAVALLRALERGRLVTPEARDMAVRALERAAAVVLPKGPLRDALAQLVEQHGAALRGPAFPPAALPSVAAFSALVVDRHGLLLEDERDVAVLRLNEMVWSIYRLPPPAATGDDRVRFQGERYLHRYLEDFPYFRRIDLLERRGRRARPLIDDAEPRGLDR
jgi:hypothetical protein